MNRPGSPFVAWTVALALAVAALQAQNPAIWYSADVLGLARVLAAATDGLVGAFIGAIAGAVVGFIAAMAGSKEPLTTKAQLAAVRTRNLRIVLGALVVGIGLGTYQLVTTDERESFVACNEIQAAYPAATTALKAGDWKKTTAITTTALARQKACHGSAGGPVMKGALLALRGAALYRTELTPEKPNKDLADAESALKACATKPAMPGANEKTGEEICTEIVASVDRYRNQHFCTDSYAQSNQADNALYHDPRAARAHAEKAVELAGKCKNAFTFAYRGIALGERGQAELALGDKKHGQATLHASQAMLSRCISVLSYDKRSAALAAACKATSTAVASALSGNP